MSLASGKLRHRVTLQRYSVTQDDYGQEIETWADLAERWASVEPLSGREYWQAQQVNAELTIRVRLRCEEITKSLTARDRAIYQGRTLELISPPINVGERNVEIHLMCREIAS